MKYSTLGLKGTPDKLQGSPAAKILRPPFSLPRSVPILPTDMSHTRHRSDSINMTNSSLYQLVTKRKLSPEFAMMSHSAASEDLSQCLRKRARKEVGSFESSSSIRVQERLSPARDSRSYPYFGSERERLIAPRRCDFNPPPLEPIVVRKEVNRAVLSSEERSLQEKSSIDFQNLFPDERVFTDFGRNTAPGEVSHFRSRMVYDNYLSANRSIPEAPLLPNGKDLYTPYYHPYQQQQGSKGHPKAKLEGLMTSGDSRRTSMDGHSGEESARSAFHPGYPLDGSYNGFDGSSIMRDYQGFGRKNHDELRKYTERDKFHEAVDMILSFRKQQGLQMTEGYLRHLSYPPGQNYQAPPQPKKNWEAQNLISDRRFVPRPQRQHHLTHINPPLGGVPYENGSQPWPKITEDSAGKTPKLLSRNDENQNLFKGSSAGKDSSAIISLAIKRIGRGRFGVLECLNNFAHQLHSVEKQWKDSRPDGAEFKTDGRSLPEDIRPFEADVSNHNDYTNLIDHNSDSVNDDAPLDLTTANGLREDESSRGSFMEVGVAESARLPIKKRTAKYRCLSEDDVIKQTSDSDTADLSSSTSELPHVKVEGTLNKSAPADESGSTGSASCDVTLENRLRTLIETPNEDGNLPLHLAVMKNDLDVTSALVREMNLRNMSLDRYNRQKQTPLHLAIKRQNVGVVRALLGGSSSCNIPDGDGHTGVHLSVETKNFEIFQTLCLHSSVPIDVSAINRDGLNILDLIESKKLPGEYLNQLMSSQLTNHSDGKTIGARVAGVKRCSSGAAEKAVLGVETTSSYSEHYQMLQQQGLVRQNSDSRSAAEASKPTTEAADAVAANQSPSLLYYSTSSPSALISLQPVLSLCRPASPLSPLSSSSSSQLSSLSALSTSSYPPPSLSISYRPPLPLSRSCLPLSSTSPTSSASLSLSPSYGSNAMSLYAAC